MVTTYKLTQEQHRWKLRWLWAAGSGAQSGVRPVGGSPVLNSVADGASDSATGARTDEVNQQTLNYFICSIKSLNIQYWGAILLGKWWSPSKQVTLGTGLLCNCILIKTECQPCPGYMICQAPEATGRRSGGPGWRWPTLAGEGGAHTRGTDGGSHSVLQRGGVQASAKRKRGVGPGPGVLGPDGEGRVLLWGGWGPKAWCPRVHCLEHTERQ